MTHRTFTAGDVDYIARMNALASSLDRRLAQNIALNGGMQVWQRGTSFVTGAAPVYTADRWSTWRTGLVAGATVSRQTGSDPSRYCARVQRDSGNTSTAVVWFAQPFTTENSIPLRGKRLQVRFKARRGANYSASSAIMVVRFVVGTGTDQHPSLPYTGSGNLSSTNVTLTTGWQTFEVDLGTPSGTVTEASLAFFYTPVGTAGAADYFEVTEVLLSAGTDSNVDLGDYPWRPFEEELAACQPYYEKSFPYATAPAQNAGVTGSFVFIQLAAAATLTNSATPVPFMTNKRAGAGLTVTLFNPSATNAQVRNVTTAADSTGAQAVLAYERGFIVNYTSAGGSAAGNANYVQWTAEAEIL